MILVFHNILWPRYKGVVFSELFRLAKEAHIDIAFHHIALTESDRVGLSKVDKSVHKYSYNVIIDGMLPTYFNLKILFWVFFIVLKSNPKFVILPGINRLEYWFLLLLLKIKGIKVGLFFDSTLNDNRPNRFKWILKKFFIKNIDIFFCYGIKSKEYLLSLGANDDDIIIRCQACALPLNYTQAEILQNRLIFSNKLGSSSFWRFVYIGRLSKVKSVDLLINAFGRVLKNFPFAQLVIIGTGPKYQDLCELSKDLCINDSIIFTGGLNSEEIFSWLLNSNCLVLPSQSEPWGLVVNEALSYGCPVIVSNACGCVPELVRDQFSGLVFDSGNLDDLTIKMELSFEKFANISEISISCLKLMNSFTPEIAARQILNGIFRALK